MAQADYIISNQTFPNTRADINSHLQAIATNNSGTSAPSTQYAGQFWIDTTSSTWTLYIHDGADDIQFATIDTSANTVNFIDSELGDNSVTTAKIADGNVTSAKLSYPLTTFSSTGIDDNATSTAITIDSSQNVTISGDTLTVGDGHTIGNDGTFDNLLIQSSTGENIEYNSGLGSHIFKQNGTEVFRINNTTGNVGINTSSPSSDFSSDTVIEVAGSTSPGLVINDTGQASKYSLHALSADFVMSYGSTAFFRYKPGDSQITSHDNLKIITGTSSGVTPNTIADKLFIDGIGNQGLTIGSGNTSVGSVVFADDGDNDIGKLQYNHNSNSMSFTVNASERMRIESSGNVLIGKTTGSFSTAGTALFNTGSADFVNSDRLLVLNRLSTDGELMGFYQAGSQEGSISVSGATVAYNGFTGTHWSRFADNSTPNILRGTVLESLDEMCDWYNLEFETTTITQDEDGNDVTNTVTEKVPYVLQDGQSVGDIITYNYNGTDYQATIVKEADIKHMKSKVSDTVDAKNVYGVFNSWDEDGEGYNDFYVASVGSFVVRIKANETIAKGDLLQSNGDGTAKVQTDDAVRSSSFAKVLSTTIIETYEDGSYLVPCSLMC